ncbi:MAG TPA: hypothetical protein VGO59_09845 [Verrucomicrobiae bacterium]|jgi:hypothetical protein
MPVSPERPEIPAAKARPPWLADAVGCALLAVMLAGFLRDSWRKWPDPIVDSGAQWYAPWRIAHGAVLFHEMDWTYGPLSAYFNGLLFRIFGANLSVLFAANLAIYGGILALAWAACRRAWGRLGAFAAGAVFISVFSFSHLTSIGNYNYAAPYSHETTHGMLVILAALFVAAAWCRGRSPRLAFVLGTCGGLAAVLKPEFMLAAGVLGASALALRVLQRAPAAWQEIALLAAGALWPTAVFTLGFATTETFGRALAHACNAWWRVLVQPIGVAGFAAGQSLYAGFNHPWQNGWVELKAGGAAILALAAVWSAGWFANKPSSLVRAFAILILGTLALFVRLDGGWFHVGLCLPLLIAAACVFYAVRLLNQWRHDGRIEQEAIMRWLLVMLAAAMLARMALFARVYHFGYFQAALAGMAAAAFMAGELPLWTGRWRAGHWVAAGGSLLVLAIGCRSIAAKSMDIRSGQNQPIAAGPNRFYAFDKDIDPTGALVDWLVKGLSGAPPSATLLVLPDGLSINFLTGHVSPLPSLWVSGTEESLVERLKAAPPDLVALLSLNLAERGVTRYGAPGQAGHLLLQWVHENYTPITIWGEPFSDLRLKGAVILRRTK